MDAAIGVRTIAVIAPPNIKNIALRILNFFAIIQPMVNGRNAVMKANTQLIIKNVIIDMAKCTAFVLSELVVADSKRFTWGNKAMHIKHSAAIVTAVI